MNATADPLLFAVVAWMCGISILYAGLLRFYLHQWLAMPDFEVTDAYIPGARITVVVAARNEADNLEKCLLSLLHSDYPEGLYEIIVVDDHSTDQTGDIARRFSGSSLRVLALQEAAAESGRGDGGSKKRALDWGIAHASGDFILTTDADCVVPSRWMRQMAYAFECKGWHCVAGPVVFPDEGKLFQRFQALDFLGMMLITGAGFQARRAHLANGASFGFSAAAFSAVGGYSDNLHFASGDDVFLLHKVMQRFPVGYIKSPHAVRTAAQPSIRDFIRQRLRWGTKSAAYRDRRITLALAVVFFQCWGILWCLPALLWSLPVFGSALILQLAMKSYADYRMLQTASTFFGSSSLMKIFWPAQGMHILYIAGIGLAANLLKHYTWKGRRLR